MLRQQSVGDHLLAELSQTHGRLAGAPLKPGFGLGGDEQVFFYIWHPQFGAFS